mmetsp:Transcript_35341/g.49075  ORF Transcript_35341/g.49075 Transcript_35341/m.49075 type:complete len:118 (-) Transcript_35341:69-422(-)
MSPNNLAQMDYRCHVEGGAIGLNYPPKLQKCLERLAGMKEDDIQEEYSLPKKRFATILKQRATEMSSQGFEAALRLAGNRQADYYPLHEPCCSVEKDVETGKNMCTSSSKLVPSVVT